MRPFKLVTLVLGVVVAIFVVGGFALGGAWQAERVASVPAPPARVYASVADFSSWRAWAFGDAGRDPACIWTSGGAAGAPNAWLAWQGAPCGSGKLVLVDGSAERGVWIDVLAGGDDTESPEKTGTMLFTFVAEGTGTRVTWRQSGQVSIVGGAWFKGSLEARIRDEMGRSLERLAAQTAARGEGP